MHFKFERDDEKVLVNQPLANAVITTIIHDQFEFIPGTQCWLNIRILIYLI